MKKTMKLLLKEKISLRKKSYSDAGTNVNKRVKVQKDPSVNQHRNSFNTRYIYYLYYYGCSILIDSPTNRQMDINGVGRIKIVTIYQKREYHIMYCLGIVLVNISPIMFIQNHLITWRKNHQFLIE